MYDLIAVGGGSGGLALSKRSTSIYGKRVLLIDKTVLGGTCVNNGCIPKKMLYNAAYLHSEAECIDRHSEIEFDCNQFREKREKYIAFLNNMYAERNKKDGVKTVTGTATVHKDRVEVNGVEYKGSHIVLAMGSYPKMIDCLGNNNLLSSDDFFRFESIPKSVAIIGTGYISIETAFVLAEFKCKVTLIARREGVLRAFDTLIQKKVQKSLESKGIRLIENATVVSLQEKNREINVEISHKESQEHENIVVEKVICAVGRAANTKSIKNPEIKTDAAGFVETDNLFRTSAEGVYAIGDITMEESMLTPVAIFSGRRLADYLFGNSPKNIKKMISSVPTVVFSHPPAGSVGYSEEKARDLCSAVSVHIAEVDHPSSLFSTEKNSYKFIYDSETSELHGVHVHGYECDEVLQGYSALVRNGIKYSKIREYLETIGSEESEFLSGAFE
ncbi:glutathione reductase (NADPH) [Nematocida minor]|uniref:glutathione reductase (NADPH) n=1 Tax=Nematocida minor TaxID=1912983 RepID=UPI00221E438B|nr:glutathione reductase (NADPH) [Nematocida minor]KAI5192252.1 glutathione reductase (NADPH) [Nematocida minor]